jgi:Xaa-Pro aminopeptidase
MVSRLERLLPLLAAAEVEAYLVTDLLDSTYLSGLRASNATLLVGPGRRTLVTDFRYRTQVAEEAPDWEVAEQATGEKLSEALTRVITAAGVRRVGFQSGALTFALWDKLRAGLPAEVELVACEDFVARLRRVKEPGEIALIAQAAEMADATMVHGFETARAGLTEHQLRLEMEHFLLTLGAEKVGFDFIVCGGPNSAKCHAKPGARPLADGDLLTIDLGARLAGYHSDLTRTVAIGHASDEQRAIYDLVHRAEAAGIAALKPGAVGKEIDAIARGIIADGGHAEHFGHGLGHGVGLDIHEDPRLATTSEDVLEAGQVITVEPGVYIEGLGGVRIEDLCLVTEDGCRVLSAAPKPAELMVL